MRKVSARQLQLIVEMLCDKAKPTRFIPISPFDKNTEKYEKAGKTRVGQVSPLVDIKYKKPSNC